MLLDIWFEFLLQIPSDAFEKNIRQLNNINIVSDVIAKGGLIANKLPIRSTFILRYDLLGCKLFFGEEIFHIFSV